jgi:sensor c-di-GMP phosphodiesterase-like protein
MTRADRHRQDLLRALREALRARALFLHYQPQVRLADNRLSGCEVLVRWIRRATPYRPRSSSPSRSSSTCRGRSRSW